MYVSVVCATFASCCASLYNKPIIINFYIKLERPIRSVESVWASSAEGATDPVNLSLLNKRRVTSPGVARLGLYLSATVTLMIIIMWQRYQGEPSQRLQIMPS